MKPKPMHRFRLHPNRGRCFFTVFVWKNKRQLQSYTARRNCVGLCRGHEIIDIHPNGKTHRQGSIGEIHLCDEALGIGIVTHEMTHAAFRWADHRGMHLNCEGPSGDVTEHEEHFCWVVGNLVRLFVLKAYELGLYKDTPTATVKTVKH